MIGGFASDHLVNLYRDKSSEIYEYHDPEYNVSDLEFRNEETVARRHDSDRRKHYITKYRVIKKGGKV